MAGFRNVLAHGYLSVQRSAVESFLERDLPRLRSVVELELTRFKTQLEHRQDRLVRCEPATPCQRRGDIGSTRGRHLRQFPSRSTKPTSDWPGDPVFSAARR